MFGIRLLAWVLGLIGFGIIVTQMVIPQIKGTPWFPIRNLRKRKRLDELEQARDQLDDEGISVQTRQVKATTMKLRRKFK